MSFVDDAVLQRIEEITARSATSGVRIIAIDGPAGAGKSTLAQAVARRWDAPVVEIDDFLCWNSLDSWWPRFEAHVIVPLLHGEDAEFQVRDWAGDEFGDGLGERKRVPWAPVVVIEGVSCSRSAIADALACRVWVDAPFEERLRRGIERDGETHRELWHRFMAEEERFFMNDRTRERADIIIDGSGGSALSA